VTWLVLVDRHFFTTKDLIDLDVPLQLGAISERALQKLVLSDLVSSTFENFSASLIRVDTFELYVFYQFRQVVFDRQELSVDLLAKATLALHLNHTFTAEEHVSACVALQWPLVQCQY